MFLLTTLFPLPFSLFLFLSPSLSLSPYTSPPPRSSLPSLSLFLQSGFGMVNVSAAMEIARGWRPLKEVQVYISIS